VRFGRGLNPLVVKELKQLHHQEGEPREEAYKIQASPSAPQPPRRIVIPSGVRDQAAP